MPLHPVIDRGRDHDGYRVENVALETIPGFFLTGNLYQPLPARDQSPVVLVPHGHFIPEGRFHPDQQKLCAHLARMGVTVFSYGMVGWNDLKQTTHDDPVVLALQTWNSIRAVDFVSRLPGVDRERIGITGASGGGTQSLYLALLDDRIQAVAPVVIVYPWTDPDGCKCEGGLPILRSCGSNIIEVAALCAPRSQLIVSVGGDQTKEFPTLGLPFVKEVYSAAGVAENVSNLHLPSENHDLGPSKREGLYQFFAKKWQLPLIAEAFKPIDIESPDKLSVFDEKHPLPDGAAITKEEVARAFERAPRHRDEELLGGKWSPSMEGESDFAHPAGFVMEGKAKRFTDPKGATLQIKVIDRKTGRPTHCRIAVVGPDGNYYLPAADDLSPYAFSGRWPAEGVWGNRTGKGPYRYLGKFFYSRGESVVAVPPGNVRIEVTKGFEYAPTTVSTKVTIGSISSVDVEIVNHDSIEKHGYFVGDAHLHFPRRSDRDDQLIVDLLACEGIKFGTVLAYNEPAGPYAGMMREMASPQLRHLGHQSIFTGSGVQIISGQEYRTAHFGHLNLYLRDSLVADGKRYDADQGPIYGELIRPTRTNGGIAIMAHGGYGQEIYADVALGELDAVELLQFGVYRGIGREDWYRILSSGYRFPAVGASDYPACRWLGDARTYAYVDHEPGVEEWLRAIAKGKSFVTTGPLLLLEVNGHRPGDRLDDPPPRLSAHIKLRSDVAPVTTVELLGNGDVLKTFLVQTKPGEWIDLDVTLPIEMSAWIAARAYGLSPGGMPNAEAHTNPVYLYRKGKAPFSKDAIDVWIDRIDQQMAIHRRRNFTDKAKVLDYFQRARDTLLTVRQENGLRADADPFDVTKKRHTETSTPFDASKADVTETELKDRLKPLPCLPPEDALRAFEVVPGFRVELAAAEPMVFDPIAGCFDEDGNLYIAEMRDYPYKPDKGKEPLGTVRLLRDTNGDGKYDESHIFADKLLWPAGITCWKGGVFIAACPDIWYMKDTDGDHKADIKEKVFTGFGTQNQQAMVNNLAFGIDNKIYGSTAGNGGIIRQSRLPNAKPVDLNGRDFRFDPETLELEAITGTVQFGNAFDDWGNRFVCDESEPIKQVVLPMEYLDRNPFYVPPTPIIDLSDSPVPIYRISPVERWREIRSSRRVAQQTRKADSAGASHHVIDASAGVCIYRGGAFPTAYRGQVFVGCGQNNIIHHRTLEPAGVDFHSKRVESKTEFVRTPDNWFRPVNILNTPSGTLLCLDMCREVLESIHIPLDVVKQLDLTSGRDRGRLYEIVPEKFEHVPLPRLSQATSEELVHVLLSPHGWQRDTAQRLLVERRDSKVLPSLNEIALHGESPQSRLHALWALHALDGLTVELIQKSSRDPNAFIREHAIRLAEPLLVKSPELLSEIVKLADDPSPRVRMQLAFTMGASNDSIAGTTLFHLLQNSATDKWIRAAIMSSSPPFATTLLTDLLKDPKILDRDEFQSAIQSLLLIVGAKGNVRDIELFFEIMARPEWHAKRLSLVSCVLDGVKRSGQNPSTLKQRGVNSKEILQSIIIQAHQMAVDEKQSETNRSIAIGILAAEPLPAVQSLLEELMNDEQPSEIQRAAIRCLDSFDDPAVAEILLESWTSYSPETRDLAVRALLSRTDRTRTLLQAAKENRLSLAVLSASSREALLYHQVASIKELAQSILGQPSASRSQVISRFQNRLAAKGDAANGKVVFRRVCANCHQVAGEGFAVGPALSSSSVDSQEALLANILDPNRQVAPNYEQYVVLDESGRSYTGMMVEQSGGSITLKRERGEQDVILRSTIEEIRSTGKSLMPEGLEQNITETEMADLIYYLKETLSGVEDRRTRDFGTLPGLIEPARQ
jgi:putative membrane-bound dehydrogenase-like protein